MNPVRNSVMNPVRNILSERVSNSSVIQFSNNNKISCSYRISNGVNKRITLATKAKPTARLAEAFGVAQVVFILTNNQLTFLNF